MLVEYVFKRTALAYLRQQFTWPSTLSKRLAILDINEGSVRTCLPEGTPVAIASDFRVARVTGQVETRRWLLPLIRRYLSGDRGRIALFETPWKATDDILGRIGCQVFTCDDDVYQFARSTSTRAQLEEAMTTARSYPFVGVLTSLDAGSKRIRDRAAVSTGQLHELADRAQAIIVEAYDDEGRLVWIRKGCEALWQPCVSEPKPRPVT